jgi:hypothetical protein
MPDAVETVHNYVFAVILQDGLNPTFLPDFKCNAQDEIDYAAVCSIAYFVKVER